MCEKLATFDQHMDIAILEMICNARIVTMDYYYEVT